MSLQQIHLFRGWSTARCRVYSRMKNHLRGRPLLECIHDDFWAAKEPGLNVKWGKNAKSNRRKMKKPSLFGRRRERDHTGAACGRPFFISAHLAADTNKCTLRNNTMMTLYLYSNRKHETTQTQPVTGGELRLY